MNSQKISKIITISVGIIVVIAVILLLRGRGDTAKIELNGPSELAIYQHDRFKDPGYNITDTSSTNGFYVNIDGYVNTNKIGAYYLKYYLYNKNGSLVSNAERKVIVLEDKNSNISLILNGDEEEYFFVDDYFDNGALAYLNNTDITDRLTIDSNVLPYKTGKYTVKYYVDINNNIKELIRTVHIIDYEVKEDIDLTNLNINLLVNCDNYYYTKLPDGLKEYSRDITYSFSDVGTFDFDIILKSGSHKKYTVEITSIDNQGPTGTCNLQYESNKTIITMNATDKSGIKKYSYNGLEFYNNTTTLNSIATNVVVRAYDKRDNYTDIKCKASYGTAFRKISVSEKGRVQNKKGYIICGDSVSKASQELNKLIEAYGYKTRDAVAAAAVYLATYEYDIPYFWGGKTSAKGFDTNWGCRKSHSTNHNCTKPLASDNSYCEYGLDCAGFTRWAFIQAGFDVSILRPDQQTEAKWGNFDPKTHKYSFNINNQVYINQIKPGDIVHREGHVGLVIGVDENNLQIAEMLGPLLVTTINKYTGKSLSGQKNFTDFVLFDDFYKMYGNS